MGTSFFHTKFPTTSRAEGAVSSANTGMLPFTGSSQLQQQQTSNYPRPPRATDDPSRHSTVSAAPVGGRPDLATVETTARGPLHPLRAAAPVTGRCTRYGALHPIRRGALPTDRVQHTQSQEQTRNLRDAGQAAVPVGGGGAWPGNAQTTSPTDWRPPRGLRGLAGQRVDAPSEARGADGERAGRRPQAHQAARPDEQREAARLHRDRTAHTSGDSCQKPQLSRRSRWRRRGRLRR